jgi:pimeloyl-ACP methyl ester carboxylesterase
VSLGITLVSLPTSFVELAGGPLAYVDLPPAESAPPVGTAVLVPGYTGSKEDFGLLAAPLTAAGFRFVAIDLRGQHESPGPDDPAAYTVPALGAEVLEFRRALGAGPVHLVGHSFGGLVCRDAVLRDPAAVRTFTLLDSGPAGLSGPRVERMRLVAPVLDTYGPEALFDAILAGGPRPGPELEAFLRKRFLASSVAGLRAMGAAVTDEPDRVDELRAAETALLVACGEYDDAWTPETQREMAERLGAPYVVIPGAIHSPAAEAPEATARVLLDFWRGR